MHYVCVGGVDIFYRYGTLLHALSSVLNVSIQSCIVYYTINEVLIGLCIPFTIAITSSVVTRLTNRSILYVHILEVVLCCNTVIE